MGIPQHHQHQLDWIAQAEAILGTTGGFSLLLSAGMELTNASPQHYPAIPSGINSEQWGGSDKPTESGGLDTQQRTRGVQGMGFTGETEQSFHQHGTVQNSF